MDYGFSKEQESYRAKVREFAAKERLDQRRPTDGAPGEFDRRAWQACAECGLQGGMIPPELGGQGLDLMTFIAGLEQLGEACEDSGLLFSLGAHIFSCELSILAFGSDKQRKMWLPELCSGKKIAAIGMAEEQGASDAFSLRTTAAKRGKEYVLNGRKLYVTNGPFCDLALIFARLDGSTGDIVCLLVPGDNPGMTRSPATPKMGLQGAPFGELVLKDCHVPAESRLGSETAGKLVFMSAMEWERGCLLAPMAGAMRRQLDQCITWAKSRQQAGESITRFQAVAHRIVDMKMRLEAARHLLYAFAWKKQVRRRANMEASMAKLGLSEALVQNALDALQIHGARGYTTGSGVERQLRDALATRIAAGTSDIQKNIIAEWLRL